MGHHHCCGLGVYKSITIQIYTKFYANINITEHCYQWCYYCCMSEEGNSSTEQLVYTTSMNKVLYYLCTQDSLTLFVYLFMFIVWAFCFTIVSMYEKVKWRVFKERPNFYMLVWIQNIIFPILFYAITSLHFNFDASSCKLLLILISIPSYSITAWPNLFSLHQNKETEWYETKMDVLITCISVYPQDVDLQFPVICK